MVRCWLSNMILAKDDQLNPALCHRETEVMEKTALSRQESGDGLRPTQAEFTPPLNFKLGGRCSGQYPTFSASQPCTPFLFS